MLTLSSLKAALLALWCFTKCLLVTYCHLLFHVSSCCIAPKINGTDIVILLIHVILTHCTDQPVATRTLFSTRAQNKEGAKYELIDWFWSSALIYLEAIIWNGTIFPCLPKTNFTEIINITIETSAGYTCFHRCTDLQFGLLFCT